MKPIIAIVGRTNVGKSTLFNRLTGRQVAIIEDLPGTTRDRIFADALLLDQEVTLVDTGGLGLLGDSGIESKVKRQVGTAIEEADVIVFMLDARDGLIGPDHEIADMLRKSDKPLLLVANKVDNPKLENALADFFQLGLGTPLPISAHHNRGIGSLVDALLPLLPPAAAEEESEDVPRIAIAGRPNVGKSMLLNTLVGDERVIVDATPGTTRDAVDTAFQYKEQKLVLIDTAGIRKRGKSGIGIDYYSLIRSLRAINRCDIALLVVDAAELVTAQDMHIAGYIKDAHKGMLLVVNKCDLISKERELELSGYIAQRLKSMPHVPVLYISALQGRGVGKLLPAALEIWQERHKQLPNTVVDRLIKGAVEANAPPHKGLRRLQVIRAYQDGVNPPGFTFLVNDPELLHFSYQRYLENKLRQTFGFHGTALRFTFKKAPRRGPRRSGED